MNKITRSSLETLSAHQAEIAASIYLPTHRHPSPPHIQEDQTRFKNLLREAREKWLEKYDDTTQFNELESKIDDQDFWHQTTEGMAIFISTSQLTIYHLPIECEEHVCVGESFDLTPLYALVSYDQPYYLLNLAMHNTTLLKGDMYGLEPVAIDFPTSIEDALNIDEMFANSNTIRGVEGGAIGNGAGAPHGMGDSSEAGREERLQYFRIIDRKIAESPFVDTKRPILIAGTDNEAGDYRNLTKLTSVIHPYIQGNHGVTQPQDLHALAWPLIQQEVIEKNIVTAIEQSNELKGIQKASSDLRDIIEAAKIGRVDTLLINLIRKTNDSVSDAIKSSVPILTFADGSDDNALAKLARTVFTQGGRILGAQTELRPSRVKVTAIYRY